jgi:hypothetical protein
MKRFWFEFNFVNEQQEPPGLLMGCGVTAYNFEDALSILRIKVFKNQSMPPILKFVENIDLTQLDNEHVLPNINPVSPPNQRGVWFPIGYH